MYLKKYTYVFLVSTFIFSSVLGIIRYEVFVKDGPDLALEKYLSKKNIFEGVIVSEPDVREKAAKLTFEIHALIFENQKIEIKKKTKVIVSDNQYSRLTYGDMIDVEGVLVQPENFQEDGGREFNYVAYLAQQKIFYEIKNPTFTFISSHHGNRMYEILFVIKNNFIKKLDALIPFPESGLAAGLVVAGKRALPKNVQDEFQKSGTMQVVVLSGYNVTIIAQTLMNLLSFLPKLYASFFGIVGIILFTIIAGGSATIVRASIMAVIVIVAKIVRRDYDVSRSLIVAGVLMLVINPLILAHDPSFQISFLATIGLIHMSPLCKKYFIWVPEKFKLREAVVSTIATQIFVTPFFLYTTGEVSLVSLPANLLLFLVIPITMLVCFTTGILSFITVFLAMPFAYISYILLWYELMVVHVFASVPFATISFPLFPLPLLILVYSGYAVMIFRFKRLSKGVKQETAYHIGDKGFIKKS